MEHHMRLPKVHMEAVEGNREQQAPDVNGAELGQKARLVLLTQGSWLSFKSSQQVLTSPWERQGKDVPRNSPSLLRTPAWLMAFLSSDMSTQSTFTAKDVLQQLESQLASTGSDKRSFSLAGLCRIQVHLRPSRLRSCGCERLSVPVFPDLPFDFPFDRNGRFGFLSPSLRLPSPFLPLDHWSRPELPSSAR